MKKMTMQDIADLAQVDKSIVSKVINNAQNIPASRKKVERVRAIIREYDYTPSSAAKSLATRKNRQIGFLLSGETDALFSNSVYAQMLTGVIKACHEYRYLCQTEICNFNDIQNFIVPENLKVRSIDGCILSGGICDEVLEKIAEIRLPIVVLGGRILRRQLPVISRDALKENRIFLEYALQKGHRRIGIAAQGKSQAEVFGTLRKEYPQMDIRLLFGPGMQIIDYAMYNTKCYLEIPEDERPTLIYGADHFCCVMIRELEKYGIRCPEDISFISFSDTTMSELCSPSLSVYSENHLDVGYRGAKVLIETLEKNLSLEESISLAGSMMTESSFKERKSVRDLTMK